MYMALIILLFNAVFLFFIIENWEFMLYVVAKKEKKTEIPSRCESFENSHNQTETLFSIKFTLYAHRKPLRRRTVHATVKCR